MNAVFADTFYFMALLNTRDAAHARAVAVAKTLQGQLITTAWVLTELADAMSSPANRREFLSALDDLRTNPFVQIIPPEAALFDEGVRRFGNRLDKEWSLTDCISFVVMERLGITEALTGDHHYEQAGFVALLR
jgi:predicted nucleic acid-binding protein